MTVKKKAGLFLSFNLQQNIMVGVKMVKALVMIMAVALSLGLGGQWAAAQVHHVVGGDRGWDSSSDVASWSAGRVFRAGDKIC